MAELNVQRKDTNVWPWILGGVLVLALLFWLMRGRGGDNVGGANMTDTATVGAASSRITRSAAGTVAGSAVSQYLQFVDNRPSRDANPSHEFTADGLRQLAAALIEVASGNSAGGAAWQPRVDEIRERANAMQQNPASTEHAQQTREAFTMSASVIEQMQGTSAMSATTGTTNATSSTATQSALQQAAMSIDPSRLLSDQTSEVEQFFAQAGEALRAMSGMTR